jgi:integrase/recombinase XerD
MSEMGANLRSREGSQRGSVSTLAKKSTRLLRLFEEDLKVRFAPATVPNYVRYVRQLIHWLDERGPGLNAVRATDLHAYQSHLVARRKDDGKPFSSGHHVNQVKAIKGFFRFLYRGGYLLADPAAGLEFPRMEHTLPRVILTPQEARRIMEAPDGSVRGLRDRAILETLYATGIRAGELSNLTPYDVDTEERVLRVVRGKGGKDRSVPLTRPAAVAIEAYLASSRPQLALFKEREAKHLFLGNYGGKLKSGRLSLIIRHWTQKAGVKKRVTCHTFRHSVATHLLRGRADIRHIQALLGHASLGTTERYTRVEIQDLRKVVRRAHPRGR